ncbi:hypothetical protein LEP1GSC059_0861 [Leptospira noguchii serovar Panama str. CZ214]|uniref:Uncharacterized protein n=1 Tax=Leptospira noguchii serovar Panama str. CZ214 TaxID=1001595 RepID=T0FFB1_9LEPT|nr:hypothetical protein LEP1GSC059_0861 [Leptospira noguchii serovar Panama str. CZ214]
MIKFDLRWSFSRPLSLENFKLIGHSKIAYLIFIIFLFLNYIYR